MQRPLIILTGPTAVGKTALSIGLAKRLSGEIVSADSMQVYKGMDIGTAKIRPEEMDGVPHHLIDILMPDDPFNVVLFQQKAREAIEGIRSRGHTPIVAGGTGFYIQALLYDVDFDEEDTDKAYRRYLETTARKEGAEKLHQLLLEADPVSAAAIHPNNVKRTIRALEYHHIHGQPISAHNQVQREKTSPYHFFYFVLNMDRQALYDRIDQRVDAMMADGLLYEVCRLKARGYHKDLVSMQGIGYKELMDHLDGKTDLAEAVRLIKRNTRHFAKRQLTWFKRERDVRWIEKDRFKDDGAILDEMIRQIEEELR